MKGIIGTPPELNVKKPSKVIRLGQVYTLWTGRRYLQVRIFKIGKYGCDCRVVEAGFGGYVFVHHSHFLNN